MKKLIAFLQITLRMTIVSKIKTLVFNRGIAANTNEAIQLATGEFVGFLDHDDLLAPFALYSVAEVIREIPDCDLIYSDEDKIDKKENQI